MSIRVQAFVWDRFPEGGSKLLTMLALADWASDDGGRVYPSMKTLALKIHMSKRQVIRIMQSLVADDYLENLTPDNAGGLGKSSRYRIKLETLTNCHSNQSEGDNLSDKGDIAMSRNGDIAMSHNPLDPLITVTGDPAEIVPPDQARRTDLLPADQAARVKNLISYLATLKKSPLADKRDIEETEKNIKALFDEHLPQQEIKL